MSDLRNCPFCDNVPILKEVETKTKRGAEIKCPWCNFKYDILIEKEQTQMEMLSPWRTTNSTLVKQLKGWWNGKNKHPVQV